MDLLETLMTKLEKVITIKNISLYLTKIMINIRNI